VSFVNRTSSAQEDDVKGDVLALKFGYQV